MTGKAKPYHGFTRMTLIRKNQTYHGDTEARRRATPVLAECICTRFVLTLESSGADSSGFTDAMP